MKILENILLFLLMSMITFILATLISGPIIWHYIAHPIYPFSAPIATPDWFNIFCWVMIIF